MTFRCSVIKWILYIFAAFLCENSVFCAEFSFTVRIPAGQIQCFFQTVMDAKYVNMEIDYQVIDGGDLDINFLLTNPHSTVLIQDIRRTDNTHKLDVSTIKGDYQICFDNTFSYQAEKLVFFQFFLYDASGSTEDLDFNKLSSSEHAKMTEYGLTVDQFAATMTRLRTSLNKAEQYQSLLRAYEARDRAIMEANYDRVNTWSIINMLVLVAVGAVQVYMIRSLFEDRSAVGKLLRQSR